MFILALMSSPAARAAGPRTHTARCRKTRERIQRLQARLRAGYSARQGRRLRRQMRKLQKKKLRACR